MSSFILRASIFVFEVRVAAKWAHEGIHGFPYHSTVVVGVLIVNPCPNLPC